MINNEGATTFDNNVANKQTSGRASDGTGNGTITLDDMLIMYSKIVAQGFVPNAILLSPLGWLLFARDPVMRAWGFANGGPMFEPMQGQPGLARSWYQGGVNVGPVASAPYAATTYTNVPNMFPSPLRVIVSPFLTYTSASGATAAKTNIIMADTNELGIIVIDEDVTNEEWDDPNRDIRTIKFRERLINSTTPRNRAICWNAEDIFNTILSFRESAGNRKGSSEITRAVSIEEMK